MPSVEEDQQWNKGSTILKPSSTKPWQTTPLVIQCRRKSQKQDFWWRQKTQSFAIRWRRSESSKKSIYWGENAKIFRDKFHALRYIFYYHNSWTISILGTTPGNWISSFKSSKWQKSQRISTVRCRTNWAKLQILSFLLDNEEDVRIVQPGGGSAGRGQI